VVAVRRQRLTHGGSSGASSGAASAQQRRYSAKQLLAEQAAECAKQQEAAEQQQQLLLQRAAGGGAEYSGRESLYSWGSDGKVLAWELDAEQNCDIWRAAVGGWCRSWSALAPGTVGCCGGAWRA
jgi:hypothetical protein